MIKGCTFSPLFSPRTGLALTLALSFIQSGAYAADQVATVIASIGKVSANARALARRPAIYQGE
ncbi:MAG: hypothetical protein PSV35_04725, partial [bacterium]|nr:hypothetical protein [bacterium]